MYSGVKKKKKKVYLREESSKRSVVCNHYDKKPTMICSCSDGTTIELAGSKPLNLNVETD